MNYNKIIDRCSAVYPMFTFSKDVEDEKKSEKKALDYLERYHISDAQHADYCEILQKKIFRLPTLGLPDDVFNNGYSLKSILGGCLFAEEDYALFIEILRTLGEKRFYVLQNDYGGKLECPLRLQFDIGTTWNDINSGGMLSDYLLRMPYEQYFIFGDKGNWGRFTDMEFDCPVDVYGYYNNIEDSLSHFFEKEDIHANELYHYLPEQIKNTISKFRMEVYKPKDKQ